MTTSFRGMQETDAEELLRMMAALYRHDDDVPFRDGQARSSMLQLAKSPERGYIWILEESGRTAGYLVLTFGYSLEFGGECAFIDELFVVEQYRGRGIGSAAVRYAANVCVSRNLGALLLEADLANTRATELYRRLGFHEHRRRLMTLQLNGNSGQDVNH